MNKKEMINLIVRYFLLVILALPGLYIFYAIFTPLTVYPSYYLIKLIYNSNAILLPNNIIFVQEHLINIIPACIAGSAYYLLLILNLSTPMQMQKRIKSLLFLFLSFLILNIARITLFAILFVAGFQYFDFAHKFVWYFGSIALVVILWFANIKIFKIKEIPVFTDMKKIFKDAKHQKKRRKNKKPK